MKHPTPKLKEMKEQIRRVNAGEAEVIKDPDHFVVAFLHHIREGLFDVARFGTTLDALLQKIRRAGDRTNGRDVRGEGYPVYNDWTYLRGAADAALERFDPYRLPLLPDVLCKAAAAVRVSEREPLQRIASFSTEQSLNGPIERQGSASIILASRLPAMDKDVPADGQKVVIKIDIHAHGDHRVFYYDADTGMRLSK